MIILVADFKLLMTQRDAASASDGEMKMERRAQRSSRTKWRQRPIRWMLLKNFKKSLPGRQKRRFGSPVHMDRSRWSFPRIRHLGGLLRAPWKQENIPVPFRSRNMDTMAHSFVQKRLAELFFLNAVTTKTILSDWISLKHNAINRYQITFFLLLRAFFRVTQNFVLNSVLSVFSPEFLRFLGNFAWTWIMAFYSLFLLNFGVL